jgi:CheY-like chemotaxis protein
MAGEPSADVRRRDGRPVHILLVEDNPGDVRLVVEALRDLGMRIGLAVVKDGAEALAYLRREGAHADATRPDLVLLDLNLPRVSGREVLAIVKEDADLRRIPVIVLTSSSAEEDVARSYELHANCYVTKPLELDRFVDVMSAIGEFWLSGRSAELPPG